MRGKRKVEYRKPEKEALNYWRIKKLIGLVVLVSIFGVALFILNSFEFSEGGAFIRNIAFAAMIIITIILLIFGKKKEKLW